MGKVAVIMVIRYPNVDNENKYETRTDLLDDDYDDTFIEWVSENLQDFFEEEGIEYNYDTYNDFLEDYYPNDEVNSTPPIRISYFDLRHYEWKYLEDEFVEYMMSNWENVDDIELNNEDIDIIY
jgi:hypothetical protein